MKLNPFCHLPGTTCIIPGTTIQLQAFPTLLRYIDLTTGKTWEEKLDWKGPVEDFTVLLDISHSQVEVFGKTPTGFRRQIIHLAPSKPIEQLSLGVHKKLDWELVIRRMDMEEMVPVLFELGQLVPPPTASTPILNFLQFTDKTKVAHQLKCFFKAGFHSLLTPRLSDTDFQGLVEERSVSGSPLALLSAGYKAIRSLFFQEEEKKLSLLPLLPPEFHAGRLLDLSTTCRDKISLEWSKKQLKKVMIIPGKSREIEVDLQKSLKSFRVNKKTKHNVNQPLLLESGITLYLDRFEK